MPVGIKKKKKKIQLSRNYLTVEILIFVFNVVLNLQILNKQFYIIVFDG